MKYIVNLVVSQPDHEFVSMRSRMHEKTYMQEARDDQEALNRAANRFRALGFKVHSAVISEQKIEDAKAEKSSAPSMISENFEPLLPKQKEVQKKVDKRAAQERADAAPYGTALQRYLDNKAKKMEESREVEQLEEKLKVSDGVAAWIHDFVHSDDPKFAAKSKQERIQQALGAFYAAKRALEEEVELAEDAVETTKKVMNAVGTAGRTLGKVAGKVVRGAVSVPAGIAGGIAGIKDAAKQAYNAGKTTVGTANEEVELDEAEKEFQLAKPTPPEVLDDLFRRMDAGEKISARRVQKAVEDAKAHNFKIGKGYSLEEMDAPPTGRFGTPTVGKPGLKPPGLKPPSPVSEKPIVKPPNKPQQTVYVREAEQLDEVSRKHFQQVADLIAANDDAAKRKELAQHHAEIFAKQNPRFNKEKFFAAANVKLDEEAEQVDEGLRDFAKKAVIAGTLATAAIGAHAKADAASGTPGFGPGVAKATLSVDHSGVATKKATLGGGSGGGSSSSTSSSSDHADNWKSLDKDPKVAAARTAKYHDVKNKGGTTQQAWDAAHSINEEAAQSEPTFAQKARSARKFNALRTGINREILLNAIPKKENETDSEYEKRVKQHPEFQKLEIPEEVQLAEGFDDAREIAKELVMRHGLDVTGDHIKAIEAERDSKRPLDHGEIMAHVNKLKQNLVSMKDVPDFGRRRFKRVVLPEGYYKDKDIKRQEAELGLPHENTNVAPKEGESKAETHAKQPKAREKQSRAAETAINLAKSKKNPIKINPTLDHTKGPTKGA